MSVSRARDVFINCAFDEAYRPMFLGIVFAVIRSGFRARCALETDDATDNRFNKIQQIIEECRYGIHDISRTQVDGTPPLPRFNMPLELGLFFGAKRYGDLDQKKKRALVLDTERFRYQRFISDIAGQDIHAHDGDVSVAIKEVAVWLRNQSKARTIPGGGIIADEFKLLQADLPTILRNAGLDQDEMTFGDFTNIVVAYLALP